MTSPARGGPDTAGMREALDPRFRDQLAKVLTGWPVGYDADNIIYSEARDIADALLPVVQRLAVEKAAEELRAAIAKVQAVYDLQCPVMPPNQYMDPGAYHAHKWWQTVLGGQLRDLRVRADALAAAAQPGDGDT